MRLAIIAPTNLLNTCHPESDDVIHLMLAQEAFHSREYQDYYAQAIQKGEHVILDNGAYELGASVDAKMLLTLGLELRPTEIVIPDKLFDLDETVRMANSFIDVMFRSGLMKTTKPFIVPQGKTPDQWVQCLTALFGICNRFGCEAPTVGILTRLNELDPSRQKTRIKVLQDIFKKWPEVKHLLTKRCDLHFLGCDGSFVELRKNPLRRYIRSIDTAKVVTQGLHGNLLEDSRVTYPRIKRDKDYFTHEWRLGNSTVVVDNIKTAMRWARSEKDV